MGNLLSGGHTRLILRGARRAASFINTDLRHPSGDVVLLRKEGRHDHAL